MPTINNVANKIAARHAAEQKALIARNAAAEASIEDMLANADTLAYHSLRLREMLALIEAPLITCMSLAASNEDISLELANKINSEFIRISDDLAGVMDAVEAKFGPAEQGVEDAPCDCCNDQRAAEAAFTDGSVAASSGMKAGVEFIVRSLMESAQEAAAQHRR